MNLFTTAKSFFCNSVFRKRIAVLIFLAAAMLSSQKSEASHGLGGEITWTCLPGGQFQFRMIFYRDCNGIPGPSFVNLSTTVPGIPTIPMALYSQNDISYDGVKADGITICATCNQGGPPNPIPGLVEEFIYQSAPITLTGVPPATGWVFSWGECCRSGLVMNITPVGATGFGYRAIMYPYQGTNTQPCFDSSPYFVEKPPLMTCTGAAFTHSIYSEDPERDSLVYSWGTPVNDVGGAVTWAPGYSTTSQLPSPTQNPANIAATLNPVTGEINFTSFTGGWFLTVVKVTAYKCGIKVAEIFRDMTIVLNNNCDTIMGGPNHAPVITPPFTDPITGSLTSFADTVIAGDTVNFVFTATDSDQFLNSTYQTVTIEGDGIQFGANFTDPDSGCFIPPCATIAQGLPISFLVSGQINFNWVTTCAHAQALPGQCMSHPRTFTFLLKSSDNFCSPNGITLATILITVLPVPLPITTSSPATVCQGDTLLLTASGSSSYLWSTGDTTSSILVTQPGSYTVYGDSSGTCPASIGQIVVYPGTIPNVTALASEDTLCFYGPPTMLSGSPAGGTWAGPGTSGSTFTPYYAGVGIHNVIYTVTDSVGCMGKDTVVMLVTVCTGFDESGINNGFTIYPNPAMDQFSVELTSMSEHNVLIELFNVYGQNVSELFRGKISQGKWIQSFDISLLRSGVYYLKISGTKSGSMVVVKY